MAPRSKRDPRTKEEVLNRMLSYDFNGDIRDLGVLPATIQRTGPHTLRLIFPDSGTVFDFSVHRPREFAKRQEKPAPARRPPADRSIARIEPTDQSDGEREERDAPRQKRTRRQRVDRSVPPSQRRAAQ